MKKVRYAVGAVGVAPALVFLLPSAASAATPTPKKPVKTVSLEHSKTVRPADGCTGHDAIRSHAGDLHIAVFHTSLTACVGGVSASLKNTTRTGLLLRTRAYSFSGGVKTQYINSYAGGAINHLDDSIDYYQGIHQIRPRHEQVCDAIVYASNKNRLYAGPICVSFG
jgi:hypothetical protein